MSSVYSTNLRTELIGTGDQAGNWGATTNGSLGTIIEQAIAGVSGGPYIGGTYPAVNFPTDADITLTANNGSVDQARSAVLVVTSSGSLTATRNIIAPASASKIYIINNSTTGGQSIQIKYATGSGIVIPSGQTVSVYGDGTNFYASQTNVTNATNATNSTTKAVGDNTTAIATTAFVQTAIQTLYPVGSIYTSTVSTNPNTLFGFGTWTAFGAGRVMIGQDGSSFIAGATGGSADAVVVNHTHSATSTVTDPGHSHAGLHTPVSANNPGPYVGWYGCSSVVDVNTSSAVTGITVATTNTSTGVSATNANLQPYIVVYMWNRTA